jgi:polynucleotide 5'-hydroxyl-kinase GRC3/NOL9
MSPEARPEGPHVPEGWLDAASAVRAGGRVAVLGATDTGKTTFCAWLLARLEAAGLPALGLDADPGQSWIGPPACAALGRPGEGPRELRFLGATEPVGGAAALFRAVRSLAGGAGGAVLVANTAGLVSGPGLWLQPATVRALGADLVVAIERGGEAGPLVEALGGGPGGVRVLRLRASPRARRRSQAERRRARAEGFARAFAGAGILDLPRASADAPADAAGRTLCAAIGARGETLALALALGEGRFLTAAPARLVRRVEAGRVALDEDWRETRRPGVP